jgi:hypothetical protein
MSHEALARILLMSSELLDSRVHGTSAGAQRTHRFGTIIARRTSRVSIHPCSVAASRVGNAEQHGCAAVQSQHSVLSS